MTEEYNAIEAPPVDPLGDDGLLPTPALNPPAPQPDAHLGTIEGVSAPMSDSGTVRLSFILSSDHTGTSDFEYTLFPPMDFVNNYSAVFEALASDPDGSKGLLAELLPEIPGGEKDASGKWLPGQAPNLQLSKFLRTVANKNGDAILQRIQAIAKKQGRTMAALGIARPQTWEAYVEALNRLLAGTRVVFTRFLQKSEQFGDRLRVGGLQDPEVVDNPKLNKKYRRLYLNE